MKKWFIDWIKDDPVAAVIVATIVAIIAFVILAASYSENHGPKLWCYDSPSESVCLVITRE
jgi:hypothetical protein